MAEFESRAYVERGAGFHGQTVDFYLQWDGAIALPFDPEFRRLTPEEEGSVQPPFMRLPESAAFALYEALHRVFGDLGTPAPVANPELVSVLRETLNIEQLRVNRFLTSTLRDQPPAVLPPKEK